jgi:hypothetical protein
MPKPPPGLVVNFGLDGEVIGKEMKPVPIVVRSELVLMGEPYWDWERPASYQMGATLGEADRPPEGEQTNRTRTDCGSMENGAVPLIMANTIEV